jgi:hypothetical protein
VRLALGIPLALGLAGVLQFAQELQQRGLLYISMRWTGIFGLGLILAGIGLALFVLTWTAHWAKVQAIFNDLFRLSRLGKFNWFYLCFDCWLFISCYGTKGKLVSGNFTRFALFSMLVLVGGSVSRHTTRKPVGSVRLYRGLIAGVGYQVATYLPAISTYPLTLGWSESSRYYYASLFSPNGSMGSPCSLSVASKSIPDAGDPIFIPARRYGFTAPGRFSCGLVCQFSRPLFLAGA